MSVSFPLKSWISFLEADYVEHDPDHSQFLQIVICLSPQPVAKFYALSKYIQIDKLVERIYQFLVVICSVKQIPKLQFHIGIMIRLVRVSNNRI